MEYLKLQLLQMILSLIAFFFFLNHTVRHEQSDALTIWVRKALTIGRRKAFTVLTCHPLDHQVVCSLRAAVLGLILSPLTLSQVCLLNALFQRCVKGQKQKHPPMHYAQTSVLTLSYASFFPFPKLLFISSCSDLSVKES